MKKTIIFTSLILFSVITFYIVWWNLPITINRRTDIKLGEQIIKNIEQYESTNGLPDNHDWETLKNLGFRDKIDYLQPEYYKLNEEVFELIYIEGFDGPYLMWNSKERIWKEASPTLKNKQPDINSQ